MNKLTKFLFKRIIKKAKIEETQYWLNNLRKTGYSWVELSEDVLYQRIRELNGINPHNTDYYEKQDLKIMF
jgi:hypothetical protein